MQTKDELATLTKDLAVWRSAKKHRSEPIPAALLAKAKQISAKIGPTAVMKATRIDAARLRDRAPAKSASTKPKGVVRPPAHSVVSLTAPATCIAELGDQASGVVLRLFAASQTSEALMAAFIRACRGGVA